MAIEPIQQNGTILSGLVVVPVVDILSMFRRWASGPQRRVIRRVRPIGQKDWVMIADPENHITVEPAGPSAGRLPADTAEETARQPAAGVPCKNGLLSDSVK